MKLLGILLYCGVLMGALGHAQDEESPEARKAYQIEVASVDNHRQIQILKRQLTQRLPEKTVVYEKQISRKDKGVKVILNLTTTAEEFEVKDAINRLPVGDKFLSYLGETENLIQTEIQ